MKTSLAHYLMGAASTLNKDVAPHVREQPYALGHVGTIGLLLVLMALLAICTFSATISIIKLARLEPAIVFR